MMEILNSDLILAVMAIIPAAALMIMVYRADKVEREPFGLLAKLVVFGLVSTAVAATLETILCIPVDNAFEETSMPSLIITYFIIVAFSEEGMKYLMTKVGTWKSVHFNCTFDGVVYAVFSALAFALFENIGYVFMYGFGNAIIRAVTAVPGHCCFGVFMGVYYGLAKKKQVAGEEQASKHYRRMAVFVPAFMHGVYDFLASVDWTLSFLLFLAFVICMFILAVKLLKKAQLADEYLVNEEEAELIAGADSELWEKTADDGSELKGSTSFSYQKFIK